MCERERERERVCVCVCVCERERERVYVCVCVCVCPWVKHAQRNAMHAGTVSHCGAPHVRSNRSIMFD